MADWKTRCATGGVSVGLCLFWLAAGGQAADRDDFLQLMRQFNREFQSGDYAAAEATARRQCAMAEGPLVKSEAEGEEPDYAQCLHEAKRWVRKQDRWHNPHYWAPFVLVGPP